MAVMTNIQQDQNKSTTDRAHSGEATAMDLDVNGTTKQDDSSTLQNPATLSSSPIEKDNVDSVNGNPKGVNAPPSPPVPTPPLHISVDGAQDLSDLHITSPAAGSQPKSAPNPSSSPQPDEEAISPGTKMDMDDDPISPLTSAPRSNTASGANATPEATKPQRPTISTDHEMVDAPASSVKTGRERENDEGESQERPSKRAKTDELEDKPLLSQASTSTGPMPKVQAKYALQILRTIRRTKDAGPFLVPVDPVKLAIPTYFDYVKNPMDLSTMEKKLQSDQYATVEDLVKDFKLIISNCLSFNGSEHKISEMAKGMEATFERQMKNMPPPDHPEPPEKKSHKKGSASKSGGSKPKPTAAPKAVSPPAPTPAPPAPAAASTVASAKPKAASAKPKGSKAPKREAKTTQSQTFALDPSGMPTIRRESVQSDGRPKREIHPPPPRDLPYSDVKPRRKKTAAELKFCDQVMKELLKKQHEAFAYPFYAPVDPVALNIPDYFRIIKKPMDLSTMQNKLKTNQYDNANEFEADMRLMLTNCYKFNPNGTAVNTMGRKIEEVFNKKWAEKTAFIQSQSGSRSPVSASPPPDEEGEMSGDEDPQVEILQKQLEIMQKQLEAMKGKKKSPPAPVQGSKKGKAGGPNTGRKGSISQPASQRKKAGSKKVEEVPLLSMEEKTELSQRINLLSPNKMLYATKLIQDNLPNLSGDDEIELDIDDLPPEILYKLHKYVTKHAPPAPQNADYGYPAPPAPAAAPKQKAAPRPKKNKPMSATEQEAKIKDLNEKLAAFENPSLARQNAKQFTTEAVEVQEEEESSSDDDESSNSESEEE